MFCIHCGKKIDDNAAFCGYCGGKLQQRTTAPEPEAKALQIAESAAAAPKVANGKKTKAIVLIVCAAVVLASASGLLLIKPWDNSRPATRRDDTRSEAPAERQYTDTSPDYASHADMQRQELERMKQEDPIKHDSTHVGHMVQALKAIASDPQINPSEALIVFWDCGGDGEITMGVGAEEWAWAFFAMIPTDNGCISASSQAARAPGASITITVDPAIGQVQVTTTGITDEYLLALIDDIR